MHSALFLPVALHSVLTDCLRHGQSLHDLRTTAMLNSRSLFPAMPSVSCTLLSYQDFCAHFFLWISQCGQPSGHHSGSEKSLDFVLTPCSAGCHFQDASPAGFCMAFLKNCCDTKQLWEWMLQEISRVYTKSG